MHMHSLFLVTLMCFVSSQIPLNLTGWKTLSPADQTNCETIGGYRSTLKTINIYGGETNTDAKYTYSPSLRSFTATETTSNSFSTISQSVQRDNALFYFDGTGISQYDMLTDTITQVADMSPTAPQSPSICFDDNDPTLLYAVGDGEIWSCSIPLTFAAVTACNASSFNDLSDVMQSSCQVYNSVIYVFGGLRVGDNMPLNETWSCDASACVSSCSCSLIAGLSVARGGIRSVRVACFDDNYVVLIGGTESLRADASAVVEIFDLKTETLYENTDWNLNLARKHFAAVYEPETEEIFVFGGHSDNDNLNCSDSVQVTNTGIYGLCYTSEPSMYPTQQPTFDPTQDPTIDPTVDPTTEPTVDPTIDPTVDPTVDPTAATAEPTAAPLITGTTEEPTKKPTRKPYSPEVKTEETAPTVYVFFIVILVIICCIVCLCAWVFSKQEDENSGTRAAGAVTITYCDNCEKPTPCTCDSCNKCGQSSCKNDCGLKCQNCDRAECDGNVCRKTQQ